MSSTLAASEIRVRFFTGDYDLGNPGLHSRMLRQIIMARAQIEGANYGYPRQMISAFVTLSNTGSSDFTPAYGGFQPHMISSLRLSSDGYPIVIVSNEQMEQERSAQVTLAPGDPRIATFIQGTGQTYQLRFYPRPGKADTVAAILEEAVAATYTDATVLPFSNLALRAIELHSAADSIMHMSPEARVRIEVGDGREKIQSLRAMATEATDVASRTEVAQKRGPHGLQLGSWR